MLHRLHHRGYDEEEHGRLLQSTDDTCRREGGAARKVEPSEYLIEGRYAGQRLDGQIEEKPDRYGQQPDPQEGRQLVAIDIESFEEIGPNPVEGDSDQNEHGDADRGDGPRFVDQLRDGP